MGIDNDRKGEHHRRRAIDHDVKWLEKLARSNRIRSVVDP
jgi:hypothetical protein